MSSQICATVRFDSNSKLEWLAAASGMTIAAR
jgi:hypothetical protein